jgi:hypothetical protein
MIVADFVSVPRLYKQYSRMRDITNGALMSIWVMCQEMEAAVMLGSPGVT